MHVWNFAYDFLDELIRQLKDDETRWGNTWLQRMPVNQEIRIEEHIRTYFDMWRNVGTPVPWLKIAGLAMIGWVRENHPELWDK